MGVSKTMTAEERERMMPYIIQCRREFLSEEKIYRALEGAVTHLALWGMIAEADKVVEDERIGRVLELYKQDVPFPAIKEATGMSLYKVSSIINKYLWIRKRNTELKMTNEERRKNEEEQEQEVCSRRRRADRHICNGGSGRTFGYEDCSCG